MTLMCKAITEVAGEGVHRPGALFGSGAPVQEACHAKMCLESRPPTAPPSNQNCADSRAVVAPRSVESLLRLGSLLGPDMARRWPMTQNKAR